MIRRWSYLNHINLHYNNLKPLDYTSQVVAFKVTTSYRRRLFSYETSRPSRRFYAKLKRLSTLIHYNNILSNWSQDYLFFKKYNRFIISYKIFKHSYIVNNLLLFKKSPIYMFYESENTIVSYLVYNISKYFKKNNPSFYSPFIKYKGGQLLYVTSNNSLIKPTLLENNVNNSEESLTNNLMYLMHQSSWYLTEGSLQETYSFQNIFNFYFDAIILKIIELYKITNLLVLNKIL